LSVYTRYPTRSESIFDLGHIGELSANRTIPLLVSPQVLYALQNVAMAEIADPNRFAVILAYAGYYRLQEFDTDEYAKFLEISNQVALQLSDYLQMSTPLNFRGPLVVGTLNQNCSAGLNNLALGPPPDGEAWVIQRIGAININTNPAAIQISTGYSGNMLPLITSLSPGVGAWVLFGQELHLGEDSIVSADFSGCNAGDDIYLRMTGYIMELIP